MSGKNARYIDVLGPGPQFHSMMNYCTDHERNVVSTSTLQLTNITGELAGETWSS